MDWIIHHDVLSAHREVQANAAPVYTCCSVRQWENHTQRQLLDAGTLRLCARCSRAGSSPGAGSSSGVPKVGRAGSGQLLIFRCADTYWDAFPFLHEVLVQLAITDDKVRYLKMGFRKMNVLRWESPLLVNKKSWVEWLGNICSSLLIAAWNPCQSWSPGKQLSENWWFFTQLSFQRNSRHLLWKLELGSSRWYW